eukprot:TRINITY_DN12308_c0_g1_i3.p1 TRINITY_DN12308_c0_g1~~TRINITY_DN12308_c0_g1_i3.p1  ORF type:complete len:145 (-),score=34.60 TRINITY_DN12308_c0_g1_i3:92-526(-)
MSGGGLKLHLLSPWQGFFFFFQAEDGIRDAQESRGLGDVYKRQDLDNAPFTIAWRNQPRRIQGAFDFLPLIALSKHVLARTVLVWTPRRFLGMPAQHVQRTAQHDICLLYTSDAADEEDSVDLGGRRIIKKKKKPRVRRVNDEY